MESGAIFLSIIFLLLRVLGATFCSSRADYLNRSVGGWALLGLIFPIIGMIIISCLKTKVVWHKSAS